MAIRIKKKNKSEVSNKRESCSKGAIEVPRGHKLKIKDKAGTPDVDIDKIAIIVPRSVIPNTSRQATKNVKNIKIGHQYGVQKINTQGFKHSFKVSFKLPSGKWSNSGFLVQIDSYQTTSIFLRIEYNPAKADMVYAEEYIDAFFVSLCGEGFFDIISRGRYSSIDVCQDRKNEEVKDYLIDLKSVSTVHPISKGGRFETQYFGASGGNRLKVYNKRVQGKKSVMRLERTFHPKPSDHVVKLHEMGNPFLGMRVYDLRMYMHEELSQEDQVHMRWFISHCRLVGLKKARREVPSAIAKPFAKLLDPCELAGWDLKDDWETLWVSALKRNGLYRLDWPEADRFISNLGSEDIDHLL